MKSLFIEEGGCIMNKKFFYSLLIIWLVVSGILIVGFEKDGKGAAKVKEPPKIEEVRPLRNSIEIKAEGELLHYQRESFWNREDFSEILKSKEKFASKEINSFKKTLERYSRYAVNPKIKFDEPKKSTALICDIKGAKEGSWFDFDWFLRPYGLDFIDSHFQRREKELYWEGKVERVKTTISIKFPYSISNCHEHVWPAK
jgi:hypothetical protein